MAIKFTEEETELLYKNGFTDDDIQYTINEDRKNGVSDEQIQANFNNVINKYSQENINNYQNAYKNTSGTGWTDLTNQIKNDNTLTLDQKKALSNEIRNYRDNQANKTRFKEGSKALGQGLLGGGLMALSLHPAMNIPYVGTGASGALFNVGDAITHGKSGNEILGDATEGFIIGEAVGAVPYAGKIIGKTPAGKAITNKVKQKAGQIATSKVGQAVSKIANSQAVKKLQNKLSQEVKNVPEWLNYASSAESPIAKPIRNLVAKAQKLPSYAFPGIKPETVQRAINPSSKALDLTTEDAERLALDTTERFRDAYNTLKAQRGEKVAEEALKLTNSADNISVSELQNDIASLFNKDTYGRVNPSRALEGQTENELYNMLDLGTDQVSPYELLGLKRQLGKMTNWDIANNREKNKILEQLYGKFNNRLNQVSPELANANKQYAELYDLLGERSRLRNILNPKANIETATSALKNYKTTNDNIYQLEDMFVNELGEKPFLNNIDDINAALDINNTVSTGFNPLGITQNLKNIVEKPILYTARGLNRAYQPLRNFLKPTNGAGRNLLERGLIPVATEEIPLLLQGGVEMNVPYDETLNY